MNHTIVRIIFFGLLLICSSCRNKVKLPYPISDLEIGMTKQDALTKIKSLRKRNIVDDDKAIIIESIKCEIEPRFCVSCIGEELEGIIIRSKDSRKLYESLIQNEYLKEDLNVEKMTILKSMFGQRRLDTAVCIYSDRLTFNDDFRNLECIRRRHEPCWHLYISE